LLLLDGYVFFRVYGNRDQISSKVPPLTVSLKLLKLNFNY